MSKPRGRVDDGCLHLVAAVATAATAATVTTAATASAAAGNAANCQAQRGKPTDTQQQSEAQGLTVACEKSSKNVSTADKCIQYLRLLFLSFWYPS